ncbi:hypothetical protein CTA1_744 [Colletotrichum tanaceti]|uniref:Uncharacterized protein n=1 Tax=Colletotrichum tanaceti TaxID=1306861 RepID=A0A4U6XQH5_9PEZI|nr:hypothetical protein CTA1_744 [Colletotrichum tanaceti]
MHMLPNADISLNMEPPTHAEYTLFRGATTFILVPLSSVSSRQRLSLLPSPGNTEFPPACDDEVGTFTPPWLRPLSLSLSLSLSTHEEDIPIQPLPQAPVTPPDDVENIMLQSAGVQPQNPGVEQNLPHQPPQRPVELHLPPPLPPPGNSHISPVAGVLAALRPPGQLPFEILEHENDGYC